MDRFELPPLDATEPADPRRPRWWQVVAGAAGAVVFLAACMAGSYLAASRTSATHDLEAQNKRVLAQVHNAVTAQIPGLEGQLARDDKAIAAAKYELNEAVAAIERLAHQVIVLGGNPGEIKINPPPGG